MSLELVRQEINTKRRERQRLARAEIAAGRRPFDNPRVSEIDAEIALESTQLAKAWEEASNLSVLDAEEQVQIPQSVFELLLLHFECGLSREEQLKIACDGNNLAHLAAIKLCYDED